MRFVQGEIIHYNIKDATKSQEAVLNKFFGKIREWMVWEESDEKDPFIPLRLTVRGADGTGKSFIINTIVSYLHRMFGDNDVVHVLAPTGIAAFNVLGETLHIFARIDWKIQEKEC
jgi:pantothenate kinase-related protein Tda10